MKKSLLYTGILGMGASLLLGPDVQHPHDSASTIEVTDHSRIRTVAQSLGSTSLQATEKQKTSDVSSIGEQLTPYLAENDLEAVEVAEPARTQQYADSLVIAPAKTDCATEFILTPVEGEAHPTYEIAPGIFGKRADMANWSKISGDEMYNGTFGHGDEVVVATQGDAAYLTLNTLAPTAMHDLTEYLGRVTSTACEVFAAHLADPNSGYPG